MEQQSEVWRIQFLKRADQPDHVPARDFLDGIPVKIATEIHAVLNAVAEAPPPAFSGGGKWQAMHGAMAGIYEIRVQGAGRNYRLFCILDRGDDLGGPSIVCIGGLTKPPRAAAGERDYRRIRQFVAEFERHRTVLG